jgi:hypothetical protein
MQSERTIYHAVGAKLFVVVNVLAVSSSLPCQSTQKPAALLTKLKISLKFEAYQSETRNKGVPLAVFL